MGSEPTVSFNGPVQAGAIGCGDGQTVVGEYHETGGDGREREARPDRPNREPGPGIVADSVEIGPDGTIIRGQR